MSCCPSSSDPYVQFVLRTCFIRYINVMDRPDASVWRERKRVFLNKEFCRAVLLSLAERGKTDNALDQQPNHLAQRLGSFWKKPLFKQLVKHVSFFGTFYSENCIFPPPLSFPWCTLVGGVSAQRPFLTAKKMTFVETIYFICSVFPFHPAPIRPLPSCRPLLSELDSSGAL